MKPTGRQRLLLLRVEQLEDRCEQLKLWAAKSPETERYSLYFDAIEQQIGMMHVDIQQRFLAMLFE